MPLLRLARKLAETANRSIDSDATQFGAIPYRVVDGQPVFLMITSRRSANWVFPKGWLIEGMTPQQTAAQEAFEEAGIRGEVGDTVLGGYLNPRNDDPSRLVRVQLFPMLVTDQLEEWPEDGQRFRHWALIPELRRLMASKHAARVAADLHRNLLTGAKSA